MRPFEACGSSEGECSGSPKIWSIRFAGVESSKKEELYFHLELGISRSVEKSDSQRTNIRTGQLLEVAKWLISD